MTNAKAMFLLKQAISSVRHAVAEELTKKAKLGLRAVVSNKDGQPKVVAAKTLVKQMKNEAQSVC